MVTKFVCMIKDCDFITEDEAEAKAHAEEHHKGMENAGAKVTIDNLGILICDKIPDEED